MLNSLSPSRYDDYDYAEVNHLLERILKLYIKTVTCSPEKMDPQMFERFWKQFKHSEKVGCVCGAEGRKEEILAGPEPAIIQSVLIGGWGWGQR